MFEKSLHILTHILSFLTIHSEYDVMFYTGTSLTQNI